MRCGDRGHVTVTGEPCGQPIGGKTKRCIWHTRNAEERRALALKGGLASRMLRYLPATTPRPEFSSIATIVTWAEETARKVLTGALDPRATSEARQLAQLTIQARQADAQQGLLDALMRLEHGGVAVALLAQLQTGVTERRHRPLPGARVVPMTPPPGDSA